MSVASSNEDKRQIGLTPAGNAALAHLMDSGLFAQETDAYRFAIAYSLAKGWNVSDAPEGGYQTKFNAAGGLDVYQEIRDLISMLRPEYGERPYASAERLAELGVTDLARRFSANESMADILGEFDMTNEPSEDSS